SRRTAGAAGVDHVLRVAAVRGEVKAGAVAGVSAIIAGEVFMAAQWQERIVCDPDLHHGEPCVRGTRISVAIIVGTLAEMSVEQLLAEYPQLTREDVQAALLYAAEAAHN